MNGKGFASISLIVLVIVLAGAAVYFVLVREPASSPAEESPQTNTAPQQQIFPAGRGDTPQIPPPSGETVGWKVYRNEKYGFEFKYPTSAILHTPPGDATTLSSNIIAFEKESSFYNLASVTFFVYQKGVLQHYPQSDNCKIYRRSTRTIDGKIASIVEQNDCPGSEGSPTGGSGHTLTAIISISDKEDLVYTANLANVFIRENNFGEKILDTLKFIR